MKEKWLTLSKWNKIGIMFLIATILVMILGLILIGTSKTPETTLPSPFGNQVIPSQNGFDVLKVLNIGQVLSKSASEIGLTSGTLIQLQFGCAFAAIITPILFISAISTFGYSFYLSKKTQK